MISFLVIKHLSLMLCAKFDGSFVNTFKVIVKNNWLTFCGHGVSRRIKNEVLVITIEVLE